MKNNHKKLIEKRKGFRKLMKEINEEVDFKSPIYKREKMEEDKDEI